MDIKADIIDYMGQFSNGVLVLLSVMCDGEYSEATLFYNENDLLLTVNRTVEEKLGCQIEEWSGYRKLLESIFVRLVPVEEIRTRIDIVDFDEYLDMDEEIYLVDEIDDTILTATQSNLA